MNGLVPFQSLCGWDSEYRSQKSAEGVTRLDRKGAEYALAGVGCSREIHQGPRLWSSSAPSSLPVPTLENTMMTNVRMIVIAAHVVRLWH